MFDLFGMTLGFSDVPFVHNKSHLGRYRAISAIEADIVQYSYGTSNQ